MGEEPPYHGPVFITHHPREPLEKLGGTTFTFVTDGIEAALEQAQEAAGEKKISIAGGARTIQQYLAAGLVEEAQIHVVPKLLGAGARLLDDLGDDPPSLELIWAVDSPTVTHLKYRVSG